MMIGLADVFSFSERREFRFASGDHELLAHMDRPGILGKRIGVANSSPMISGSVKLLGDGIQAFALLNHMGSPRPGFRRSGGG